MASQTILIFTVQGTLSKYTYNFLSHHKCPSPYCHPYHHMSPSYSQAQHDEVNQVILKEITSRFSHVTLCCDITKAKLKEAGSITFGKTTYE